MRRSVLFLLALSAFATAQAGTLLPGGFPTPDANFTATFDATVPSITLATPNGADTLFAFDDSSTFLGNVFATDQGTPGQLIVTVNSGLTEEVALSFLTGSASLDGSGNLDIPVTGTPATTITDPALAALIGNSTFVFAATTSTENPFVYDFLSASLPATATATPEPAVALSVGIGLLAISALRRRKRSI